MAKQVLATTDKVTVTRQPITGAPAPQMVRIYHKTEGTSQDVFPVDAKEIVAQGDYSYENPADVLNTESPNVYKPVRPETLSEVLPEAREPLDERENRLADEDGPNVSLRGALPDDFPSRAALVAEGYDTYGRVRKLVSKGEGWHKDIPHIGDKTYTAVEDALKEK
jgi:hypothetical protein